MQKNETNDLNERSCSNRAMMQQRLAEMQRKQTESGGGGHYFGRAMNDLEKIRNRYKGD